MAKHTYEQVMSWIAVSEGGYSNHKADPGGATNYGITQSTYDAWRKSEGQTKRNVRYIKNTEVTRIYRTNYADMVRYDDLPAGVDYAVLDFAVNSGVSRAVKFVQRIVGVQADGIMGSKTLATVRAYKIRYGASMLINKLCDMRLSYMQRLPHWRTFKGGWARRVSRVRDNSLALAGVREAVPAAPAAPAKASGSEKISASLEDTLKNPTAMGAVAAQAGGLLTALSGNSPIHWVLAALILIGGLAFIVKLVRGHD